MLIITCIVLFCYIIELSCYKNNIKLERLISLNNRFDHLQLSNSNNFNEWYDMNGCQVLLPSFERVPKAIIHFIGGFIAGSAVSIGYSQLLNHLSNNGYLIIATNYQPSNNHNDISIEISNKFIACYNTNIMPLLSEITYSIPIIGLSHSLGGKLTALINSNKLLRKSLPIKCCNVFLSFNNYDSNQSELLTSNLQQILNIQSDKLKLQITKQTNDIVNQALINTKLIDYINPDFLTNNPLTNKLLNNLNDLTKSFNTNIDIGEFIPNSKQTFDIILNGYNIQDNYLIKFNDDTIDQSDILLSYFKLRGCTTNLLIYPGSHITPNLVTNNDKFLSNFLYLCNKISYEYWNNMNIKNYDEVNQKVRYNLPYTYNDNDSYDNDNK